MMDTDDIRTLLFEAVYMGMRLGDIAHGRDDGTTEALFYDLIAANDRVAIDASDDVTELLDELARDIVLSLKPKEKA